MKSILIRVPGIFYKKKLKILDLKKFITPISLKNLDP